jgi:hypothetical protein
VKPCPGSSAYIMLQSDATSPSGAHVPSVQCSGHGVCTQTLRCVPQTTRRALRLAAVMMGTMEAIVHLLRGH